MAAGEHEGPCDLIPVKGLPGGGADYHARILKVGDDRHQVVEQGGLARGEARGLFRSGEVLLYLFDCLRN